MAMQFKKPKRNLRVRDADGIYDTENEEKMDMDIDLVIKLPKSQKQKPLKKINTLSFGDEMNECKFYLDQIFSIQYLCILTY